ncbi:MAG: LysR family transcriptional regulator [Paracoccaceae bacterium]|nr:MAG: LysR family transcriptional regulator [Paracoccaceae bacterium]
MNRPPPPLNFIRSFECAARHLSFTRAAQELGYTQAAISTHVRALEKYVGRDLFVRNARSLQLTEMGAAFLPTLRQALTQIDNATDAVMTGGRDRSVIVACPFSLAENWLPACVAEFHRARPDIEVTIHGTVWEEADDRIADLVITVNRDDEVPPGAQPLWRETLSLLCAPDVAGTIREPADLIDHGKVLIAGRQEYWAIMADALATPDLAQIDGGGRVAHFKTNASNVALELAAEGQGVTIALTSLAQVYLHRKLLAEPFALRPASPWTYYLQNRGGARGASVDRLFNHLVAAGARLNG